MNMWLGLYITSTDQRIYKNALGESGMFCHNISSNHFPPTVLKVYLVQKFKSTSPCSKVFIFLTSRSSQDWNRLWDLQRTRGAGHIHRSLQESLGGFCGQRKLLWERIPNLLSHHWRYPFQNHWAFFYFVSAHTFNAWQIMWALLQWMVLRVFPSYNDQSHQRPRDFTVRMNGGKNNDLSSKFQVTEWPVDSSRHMFACSDKAREVSTREDFQENQVRPPQGSNSGRLTCQSV